MKGVGLCIWKEDSGGDRGASRSAGFLTEVTTSDLLSRFLSPLLRLQKTSKTPTTPHHLSLSLSLSRMCRGPRKASPLPSTPTGAVAVDMDAELKNPSFSNSLLLELAASDDLPAFKLAVEESGHPLDAPAPWYSRSVGTHRMGVEHRTPLQIAALYGSTAVLGYVINARPADVSLPCGTDSTTALHCAAAGGAPSSLLAVQMLLASSADGEALDAAGNRPGDVIARQASGFLTMPLEALLKASSPRPPSPETKQMEKKEKEYPPDLTLPDIKNGIYGTDEFRMYTFKVRPCSRAYSHDWTECPFVHPGENARRRDPKKFLYSCVPCPEFRKGSCRNGDNCEYAHGVFECWLHPAQYRTRLCKDEIGCNRRVCFFAHKPEELRSVNPTAVSVGGLGMPSSPRSPSVGLSSLDMAAALMMMPPGSPMSPSTSSAMASSAAWMNQTVGVATPTLQVPSSRLKSTLSARDLEFDLELMGMEGYQQKLINEMSISASPRANMRASTRASGYSELLGSLDPSMISQLQGLSLKQTANAAAQFQSSAGMLRSQTMNQQLLSGYGGNLPSSPTLNASSSLGLDHSTAKAIMNSRSSAFAKRSQSFIDRGAAARYPSSLAAMTPATSVAASSGFLDWGSPDGKLDWGVQGEELNKLRKSSSFAIQSNNTGSFGRSALPVPSLPTPTMDEPDLSWVHSLVKDGPAAPVSQLQKQQYKLNGGRDFLASEMLVPWAEQLFAEQEQMVA